MSFTQLDLINNSKTFIIFIIIIEPYRIRWKENIETFVKINKNHEYDCYNNLKHKPIKAKQFLYAEKRSWNVGARAKYFMPLIVLR